MLKPGVITAAYTPPSSGHPNPASGQSTALMLTSSMSSAETPSAAAASAITSSTMASAPAGVVVVPNGGSADRLMSSISHRSPENSNHTIDPKSLEPLVKT